MLQFGFCLNNIYCNLRIFINSEIQAILIYLGQESY
jgi:hypothetical protein